MDLEQLVEEYSQQWRADAKCADVPCDPEDFYPITRSSTYHEAAGRAKQVCNGEDGLPKCEVRAQCLVYALRIDEEHGIYGGLSRRERNALLRKWRSLDPHVTFDIPDEDLLPAVEVMLTQRDKTV